MMRKSATSAATVLVAGIVAAGCSSGDGAERGRPGSPASVQAVPVAVVEAAPRELARTVTVTGPVEPIRTVSVNAQMSGTVLRVLVEEGDRVRVAELMAELDARETRAQLQRAEAVLANAESAFQRAEQLSAGGLVTDADLDAARSAYEIAKADVELWRTRLEFTRIAAPVSGVVTAKRVERGAAVSGNQALFEIADDSLLVVRVRVSELDVVHLETGNPVTLTLDAYPDVRIDGRVRRIFPSADATSRLVPVEVVLGRVPRGVNVRPGFLARVEFPLEGRDSVLAVPASAVGVSNGETYVYLVEADTLVRRPVETGLTVAGWIAIDRGLERGERVVSSGQVNLRPGTPVRVTGGIDSTGGTR